MNTYALSYAVGYFYGRAYPPHAAGDIVLPTQDQYHRQNAGFKDGFEAGQRDYQNIDLPTEALSTEQVDK